MDKRAIFALAVILIGLLSVSLFTSQPVNAQFLGSAIINPDGTVTGTSSIQRSGDTYTLTGNISGGLQVQKGGIIIDGAGFAIVGNGTGRGLDFSVNSGDLPVFKSVSSTTVRNLTILNFTYGAYVANYGDNIFYSNYMANCEAGFWISGSSNNDIRYNTIQDNIDGVSINYATGSNIVTHNNMINSGITVWQSSQLTVDKNYWNDYTTKYPNATEVGSSGIGNTPYSYGSSPNSLADSHPIMNPISTSDIQLPNPETSPIASPTSSTPSATTQPTITPINPLGIPEGASTEQVIMGYLLATAAIGILGLALVVMLALRKRSKAKSSNSHN